MPTCTIPSILLQPPLSVPIQASFYYKEYLDTSFTLIQSGVTINPPTVFGSLECAVSGSPSVSFSMNYNTRYTLRVLNEQCETIYEEDVFLPCAQGCPSGFTLSPDSSYCYMVTTKPATQTSGSSLLAQHYTRTEYGIFGVMFYKVGHFNSNGTWDITHGSGVFPNLYNNANLQSPPPTNINFIVNATSPFLNVPEDITHGRLNLAGIWLAGNVNYSGTLGFVRQIVLTEAKVYYIGVGADDYCTIKVNGTVLVAQDVTLTSGANYFNNSLENQLFRYWNVYPVSLPSGPTLIEVYGTNTGSVGIVGLEIYDGTEAQLMACTSEGALDAYIVFSTKDVADNTPFDIGNYNCNSYPGYSLAVDGSPAEYVCQLITTTTVNCP